MKIKAMDILHDSAELRKLIAENPDLPIVITSDEESCVEGNVSTYMSKISCCVCEILNAEVGSDCAYGYYLVYDDRRDFEEAVSDILINELGDKNSLISDEEFEKLLQERVKEYEPYWHKVILVQAYNK